MAGRWKLNPRVGDKVWDELRHQLHKKHPNGKITYVNWPGKYVTVTFTDGGDKLIDFDDLEGHWHAESFGGTWMLHM